MRVSVLIPTYNRPGWLRESLNSVLSQKGVDLELVVMDHGSGPATAKVLDEFDGRIHIRTRREVNRPAGAIGAYEELALKASGELLCMFTDDDHMLRGGLKKKVDYLMAHPECAGVCSPAKIIGKLGNYVKEDDFNARRSLDKNGHLTFKMLFRYNRVCMPSVVFRREYLRCHQDGLNTMTTHSRPMGDWATWLEMTRHAPLGWIDEPTVDLRMFRESDSTQEGTRQKMFIHNYLEIWAWYIDRGYCPSDADLREMKEGWLALADQQVREHFYKKVPDAEVYSGPYISMIREMATERGFGTKRSWEVRKRYHRFMEYKFEEIFNERIGRAKAGQSHQDPTGPGLFGSILH